MIYQTFAGLYDEMMDSALYDQWLDFVMQRVTDKQAPLLELACGTGVLAVKLCQAGYQVTGLDLSPEMLTLANNRAQSAQVTLPLIEGDMLDLTEIGAFQTVTCLDDSLCYMPDLAHLKQVFQQVYQLLPAQGQFLFDMHSIYQIDDFFPGYMYNYRTEDQAFMWTSYVGDQPHSVEHDLTFFVWDDAIQGYQAINELHHERTYPLAKIVAALKAVGFQTVTTSAEFGTQPIQSESGRWFFEAQK